MGFRDEFLLSQKTYAEWSLENTTRDGFVGNQERLNALQEQVKSTFERGIDRLVQSQLDSSAVIRGELAYQTDRITEQIAKNSGDIVSAVQQGSSDVVNAIQEMSDYLGAELCEVRWAVERQTAVSEQILKVMFNSLGNESRQYFDQGVKCYETNEYDFAKERFEKALEANRTNHFAYQYLGFIAVAEDNLDGALRSFELAQKFAESAYFKALALSHLARSYRAIGNANKAVEYAKSATVNYPTQAKFWYEFATYCLYAGDRDAAISSLRNTIERKWDYWGVVSSDANFDSVRPEVNRLLDELREKQKQSARNAIDLLKRAIGITNPVGLQRQEFSRLINELENLYEKTNNVFVYRSIVMDALGVETRVLAPAERAFGIGSSEAAFVQTELNRIRALKEDGTPFTEFTGQPSIGKIYLGTVVRIVEYGAFVEIAPGFEGLLHISEISDKRVRNVNEELTLGQQIKVQFTGTYNDKMKFSRKAIFS